VDLIYTHRYESPVGSIYIAVDRQGAVIRLGYRDFRDKMSPELWRDNKYACGEVEYELDEYFAGKRRAFTVDVQIEGTPFQRAVWHRLRKVAYGSTITYGSLAQKIGRREAAQAVGNAVAANPIAILVPCHRVISAGGDIGQYARKSLSPNRGRTVKEQLLRLEGALDVDGTIKE
jgi:methylated-DNA-[protein]-cysteine S-methyltransferase